MPEDLIYILDCPAIPNGCYFSTYKNVKLDGCGDPTITEYKSYCHRGRKKVWSHIAIFYHNGGDTFYTDEVIVFYDTFTTIAVSCWPLGPTPLPHFSMYVQNILDERLVYFMLKYKFDVIEQSNFKVTAQAKWL